jgi:hypothetical protein
MTTTGISNRESPEQEAREREQHPPIDELPESREPADPQNATGPDTQTSRKAGSRASAQKAGATPYVERTMPASSKVSGAFGQEARRADPSEQPEQEE